MRNGIANSAVQPISLMRAFTSQLASQFTLTPPPDPDVAPETPVKATFDWAS